jgi:hypothetical protein
LGLGIAGPIGKIDESEGNQQVQAGVAIFDVHIKNFF